MRAAQQAGRRNRKGSKKGTKKGSKAVLKRKLAQKKQLRRKQALLLKRAQFKVAAQKVKSVVLKQKAASVQVCVFFC